MPFSEKLIRNSANVKHLEFFLLHCSAGSWLKKTCRKDPCPNESFFWIFQLCGAVLENLGLSCLFLCWKSESFMIICLLSGMLLKRFGVRDWTLSSKLWNFSPKWTIKDLHYNSFVNSMAILSYEKKAPDFTKEL